MSDLENNLDKIIKKFLYKQSAETLEVVKNRIEVISTQYKNAKFGKNKGKYEAYCNIINILDEVIFYTKGEYNEML